MKTGLKSLLIAGLLANAALMAQAQTTTPPAAPKPMAGTSSPSAYEGRGGHERGIHGRMDPAKMEAMMAKHMAEIKTKLKITAPQEGAWTAFTAALKPPARAEQTRPDPAEMEKMTTPERIDTMRSHRAQRMTQMQAQMDKREEATKTFYATLSTQQKKVFDSEHSKMMRGWGDHKDMGHGPRHEAPAAPAKP